MNTPTKSTYETLKRQVRETLLDGQAKIERAKVQTYWQTGKLIHEHILHHKDRADYGARVFQNLSRDLHVSVRLLQQTAQFYRSFPKITHRGAQFSWTHYRSLATIPDEKLRIQLMRQSGEHEWSAEILRRKAKSVLGNESAVITSDEARRRAAESYKPKLGKAGHYQIKGGLIDLGFSCFREAPRDFKAGVIVHISEAGQIREAKEASTSDLFTYAADVRKIIDGDTIWVKINLGFGFSVRQKLRFRGIDCPEIDTEAGKTAKKFVERAIEGAKSIVITTTKPDKYDRYLSDVWVSGSVIASSEGAKQSSDLINLNQLLLKQGLARIMTDAPESKWGEENVGRF